ncbi:hemerythrin [Acidovorax sp. Leaf76]|uniref:hemerythrin domain-containing protein n=1 Tax=unclassified Acidovorax TaxID=2684926 RepID=UPI0006F5B98E|nr:MULTISPECIES: hemerythrin domain-containing protein [unclassified Acidovorax]KQO26274.1 hemerythrin [Acidovorax sp. Leaf76]KQS38293.1 hemerythrin [Acidovorax sp. Leaf191]
MTTAPASAREIPGFNAPGVGFEQPFAMLEACHERVQRTLALLGRLRGHVQTHGADEPARQAARDVLRYFDIAAPLHHEDEELHVFPPLLAQGPAEVVALVQRLLQDHRDMVADWAAARQPLRALVEGRVRAFSAADCAVLDRFAERYARHIEDEERVAYPAAHGLLPGATLQAMGLEMAGRRQSPVAARPGPQG